MVKEIIFMVRTVFDDDIVITRTEDKIENADIVAGAIKRPGAVHEVGMGVYQVEDAGLFFRTAEALDAHAADLCFKLLVKDQLQNFCRAICKIYCPSNPVFRFIIKAESPFLFVAFDPKEIITECK